MYFFDEFLNLFFYSFDSFFDRKFISEANRFIRNRKMSFEDYIIYILVQQGCTNYIEAIRFFTKFKNNPFETITSQAIGKQRQFILPELFININEVFIDKLYNKFENYSKNKGFIICACDGSIMDLPNVILTRKEFPNYENTLLKLRPIRARVSCFLNIYSEHILTAKIVELEVDEISLAIEHLENLKGRLNLEKLITIYDRGYVSRKLMIKTMDLNSKFIIRLKKSDFKSQIQKMKSNDEIIEVKLHKSFLNKIEDEKLREKYEKIGWIKIRVVKVELKNGTIETLATNLTKEEFTSEELKLLYGKRWTIETGFDKLKNLVQIEEFSGTRRIIIEQDFYAHIFIYNLGITIKNDAKNRITRKKRNKNSNIVYLPNFAKIIGNIYHFLYYLISAPNSEKRMIITFLIKQASKQLTQENLDKKIEKIRKSPDYCNKHPGNKKKTH